MSQFDHRLNRLLLALLLSLALLPWRPPVAQATSPAAGVPNIYAQIITPASGAVVSGQINIVGLANALSFDHYEIYLTPASRLYGSLIAAGQTPVRRMGLLAAWDSAQTPNGEYDLHLLVHNANRTYADAIVRRIVIANPTAASARPASAPLPRAAGAPASGQAELTAPRPGQRLTGQIAVEGVAAHTAFDRYELYAAHTGATDWRFLSTNRYEVHNGVLWVWDTTTTAAGVYDLLLRVVRQDSNYDEAIVRGVVVDNSTPPRAARPALLATATPITPVPTPDMNGLAAPASGAVITGNVDVRGSAATFQFLRYDLHISATGAEQWTWLQSGEVPMTDGILANWETAGLPNGRYDLRLRVVRQDSNYSEYFRRNLLVHNAASQPANAQAVPARLLSGFISPVDGARVSNHVSLRGSATDPEFERYEVYVAPSGSERWSYVGGQPVSLIEGELWRWNTAAWPDGQYDVRLRVVRQDANYNEYYLHNLAVRNQTPAGATPRPTATPTATPSLRSAAPLPTPSLAQSGISAPCAGTANSGAAAACVSSAAVSGQIVIEGTATDSNFLRYELYVRASHSGEWWFLSAHDQQVYQAALDIWDTTRLADGRYDLKLRVVRRDSNYSDYFVSDVLVQNGQATFVPTVTPTAPPLPRITPTPIPPAAPAPGASISSPAPLSVVRGVVSVRGVAFHPQFQRYEVYVTPIGVEQWVFLSMGSDPMPAVGELLQWDTTAIPNGRYDLRLRVVQQSGNYDEAIVSGITVANPTSQPTAPPPAVAHTPTPASPPVPTAPPPPAASVIVTQPKEGARVSGAVIVSGSASHPQFLRYELWVAKTTFPGAQDWQLLLTSSQPVIQGALGAWCTGGSSAPTLAGAPPCPNNAGVDDGLWDLRLRVVKLDSNYDEVIVRRLVVRNRPGS